MGHRASFTVSLNIVLFVYVFLYTIHFLRLEKPFQRFLRVTFKHYIDLSVDACKLKL